MNYGGTNPAGRAATLAQQSLNRASGTQHGQTGRSEADDSSSAAQAGTPTLFRARVNRRDLLNITSQLAIMTRAGVDVAGALQSLVRQQRVPALRNVLEDIHSRVLSGSSLSESLGRHRHTFGDTYVASMAAAEASGRLPVVLDQLANLIRGEVKLRNSLRTMMAYPVVLTLVSGVVLLALLLFVLPRFETIFSDFDAPLPALTRMLLAVSAELRSRFWLWGPVGLAAMAGLVFFFRSPTGRSLCDHVSLKMPAIRDVTRALLIGRTCRMLGIMIDSGVPLLDSLRLARRSVNNSLYRRLFQQLENDVLNGRGLSNALLDSEFIPAAASEMVVTAEKTGTLGSVTQMIGAHFEDEGEARLKEMVSLLEPAITIVMGFVVAVIVMSVMLPLFDLSSAVKGG